MAYAEGTHFVIQAETLDGKIIYLDYEGNSLELAESRIKRMTREWENAKLKARNDRNRFGSMGRGYEEDDYAKKRLEDEPSELLAAKTLRMSSNPFDVKLWPLDSKAQVIGNQLRSAQFLAFTNNLRQNSIRVSTVTVGVVPYEPEEDTDLELELRRIALEKLSDSEKRILRVKHWDVYHKLGDRSNIDEDEMPF